MKKKIKRWTLKKIKAELYKKTKINITNEQLPKFIGEILPNILSLLIEPTTPALIITFPGPKKGETTLYSYPLKSPEIIEKQKNGFRELSCFIGHNFDKRKINNFRPVINQILAFFNIKPYYADKELKSGHILKDKIFPMIKQLDLSIFDITKLKVSVAIETGGALIIERPVILLLKRGEKPPSDLEGFDRIEYKDKFELVDKLVDSLPGFLKAHKLL